MPHVLQSISLEDPTRSQELLEGVEQVSSFWLKPFTIFHHPTLGDFELQHVCSLPPFHADCLHLLFMLPVGANVDELEEHIIQHLAAAVAMGRVRHIARSESQRRSSTQGRSQVLLFPAYLITDVDGPASTSSTQIGEGEPALTITMVGSSFPPTLVDESSQLISPPSASTFYLNINVDGAASTFSIQIGEGEPGPAITVVGSSSPPTLVDESSQLISPPPAQADICVPASEPRNLSGSPHGNSFNDWY